MSKIIQILNANGIYGLDDEGVVWVLLDSHLHGASWKRTIGSPNMPNVANPKEIKGLDK